MVTGKMMSVNTRSLHPSQFTQAHPVRVNLAILPLIVVGFLISIYALAQAPWPADFEEAQSWHMVSHWERTNGQDKPEGFEDVTRSAGYSARRVLDWLIYVDIILGALTIFALGIFNQNWLFLNLVFGGFYGVVYAASAGVTAGVVILGGGFALVLVGAVLGSLTGFGTDDPPQGTLVDEGLEL